MQSTALLLSWLLPRPLLALGAQPPPKRVHLPGHPQLLGSVRGLRLGIAETLTPIPVLPRSAHGLGGPVPPVVRSSYPNEGMSYSGGHSGLGLRPCWAQLDSRPCLRLGAAGLGG